VVDKDAVTRPAEKDPSEWVTGDEPATGPQQSYLSTLAQQHDADLPVESLDELTKAEASQLIDELKQG
jgi:hypothetical protein